MSSYQGNKPESVIATAMQYGRTANLGLRTIYGIQASQALGTVLRGSYNTFLKQKCHLLLANSTGSEVVALVSMKRYDGTTVGLARSLTVLGNGLEDYDLCGEEEPDAYGVVTVQPDTPNSIFATVVRVGENEQYRFPTKVRE